METILAIAAEGRELAGIAARMTGVCRLAWGIEYSTRGRFAGRDWILVAHGAGPRRASSAFETAIGHARPSAVLSTGFCGGLNSSLEPGQVFVALRVLAESGESFDTAHGGGGTLFSGNRVISSPVEKHRLHQATGAVAVDMEAAAVAAKAAAQHLPFFCVRVVTDTASEGFSIDLNAARDTEGRIGATRVVRQALRRPLTGIPEMIRLWNRSRLAAHQLGEYLAHYDF